MKKNRYSINLIGCFFCFILLFFFSFHSNAYPAASLYFDTVQKIYIGYYQRAADPAGLIYWAGRLDASGGNLNEIIEAYANSAESQALYGTIDSSNISTVVNDIYYALFGRNAEIEGLNYYVNGFNLGQFTPATIMLNVLHGAQNEDLQSINNKLAAANLFTRASDPDLDGTNFQVTYAGVADAIAGRNFLALYATSTKVPTQAETTAYIKAYIADPADPILPHQLINIFKATLGAEAHTQSVIIPAGSDVKFDWILDSTTSTYYANLSLNLGCMPGISCGSGLSGILIFYIYDKRGVPVTTATVSLGPSGTGMPNSVNSNGSFIAEVYPVPQSIVISAPGYKGLTFNVQVQTGNVLERFIYLSSTLDPTSSIVTTLTTLENGETMFSKVSSSNSDGVTCKTDKTTKPGRTLLICTGTNTYDITPFVGSIAYIMLRVNDLNGNSDEAYINVAF